jgi:hypothetical protein
MVVAVLEHLAHVQGIVEPEMFQLFALPWKHQLEGFGLVVNDFFVHC